MYSDARKQKLQCKTNYRESICKTPTEEYQTLFFNLNTLIFSNFNIITYTQICNSTACSVLER